MACKHSLKRSASRQLCDFSFMRKHQKMKPRGCFLVLSRYRGNTSSLMGREFFRVHSLTSSDDFGSDDAESQHGVRDLFEAGDVGAGDVVAEPVLVGSNLRATGVNAGH
jgi:hypothetical protein